MHKYIEDLGVKLFNMPYGYCSNNHDKREREWQQERYRYGFDSRETWNMDLTFIVMIYERLMMYNKINNVNTDYETVIYKDKQYTLQQMIDTILDRCKAYILFCDKEYDYSDEQENEIIKNTSEVFEILSVVWRRLWW